MSEMKLTLTLAELRQLIDKHAAAGDDHVDIVAYVEEREKKKREAMNETKADE